MNLFKKKPAPVPASPAGGRESAAPNPYLNAQRVWNSHVGSLIASRTLWQAVGVVSLLIVLASVGGLIYVGSQSKFIPYVVEVDKIGTARAYAPLASASPVDQRVVRAAVADFVWNARLVTPDIALQRKAIFQVYAVLAKRSPATNKMTAFLNGTPESSPFKRAEKETVNVEIASIIPQTAQTWQVDWKETVRDRNTGAIVGEPYRMRALITVRINADAPGASEEQMRANPLGIYVHDYAWSKQN
jgi:type IV secretion system protein VirB5